MKKLNSVIGPLFILGTMASPATTLAWTGDAELGYSSSGGNTDTTIVNGKIDMDNAVASWRHNFFGDAYYTEDNGSKTAERYAMAYKPKYFIDDENYLFGLLRYDQDKFSFIDQRTTEVIGVGRQFINTAIQYLDGEVGIGARQTDYKVDPSTVSLDDGETIAFLGGKYTGKISDNARFSQILRMEFGDQNNYTESITGLGLSIVGNLSAKISYTARHNSDVTGVKGKKTDTLTGVNAVYSF